MFLIFLSKPSNNNYWCCSKRIRALQELNQEFSFQLKLGAYPCVPPCLGPLALIKCTTTSDHAGIAQVLFKGTLKNFYIDELSRHCVHQENSVHFLLNHKQVETFCMMLMGIWLPCM